MATTRGQGTGKVGWGILGVAKINDRLLPGFAQAANAELRAVASRSLDRARQAAASAGIPAAHGSYEALLDDPAVEAVYIPLPNSLHAEWVLKAAERGKHVLCEKPLAPSAAAAQQVVDFCREKSVHLLDGFMWPHHRRTARLKQLFESGGIGELRRVTGAFTFRMEKLDPANIRLQAQLGGGSLLDVGCYPVYGARWAFGAEPVRVHAAAVYEHGVDVSLSGLLWFDGDRAAAFDCGFTLPYRGWLEVAGTHGIVSVPNMWLPQKRATFEVRREGQPTEEVVVESEDQIARMIDTLSNSVRTGAPVHPPPDEAVKTLRVLDALAKSAREGRVVTV